jgi:hypothetical protein
MSRKGAIYVCASSSLSINQDMLIMAGHLTRWALESTPPQSCARLHYPCRWPAVHGGANCRDNLLALEELIVEDMFEGSGGFQLRYLTQ